MNYIDEKNIMNKLNVLIVDDKEENIIALEALIRRDDINILSTVSPNEALKLAWDNEISLALIDVQMPGMDGFELVEMLKSNPRTKDILVIFVTAISKESKYAVKGLEAGAIDYLYKPLDPNITFAKVDSFIQLAKAQCEIKNKNIELAKSEFIIQNSADIVCLLDAHTKQIEQINPAVERILGINPDDLIGKAIYQIIPEEFKQKFDQKLEELQTSAEKTITFEFKLKNAEDELVWTECRVACNKWNFFFNISDHTLQKKYAEDLIQAKEQAILARQVKERFLANMSHELRTPLNGIIGISNLLKQTELEDAQMKMVKLLEVSSQSLLGVVNDILDISKIDSGKLTFANQEVNIKHLLHSAAELLRFKANEKLIDLTVEFDEAIPKYIEADPLRLNQILMNLLSNALKFTDKGFVKLSAQCISKTQEHVVVKFEVIDTGIGIQKSKQIKIFESYEQAEDDTSIKYGGTGLGLGIVKKLVELFDGELSFESEYGKGSVFGFSLKFKIADNHLEELGQQINNDLEAFDNVKVLVAEDNVVNQFMIAKVLKNWGIEADIVEDGTDVLEKLEQAEYDIILMDTHMPNLGGYETTKRIRAKYGNDKDAVKIISLSAAVLEEEKKAAMDAGMNYVLTKPFLPLDLHRIISKIVSDKGFNS